MNMEETKSFDETNLIPPMDKRILSLGKVLRGIGTAALVGAAATFLVQRWGVSSDIERYFGLLVLTIALPFLAMVCGIGLREGRGARVFLGSFLSILPVHFGVLGGLLYSQFQWLSGATTTPAYALWVAKSPGAALATAALAICVLVPLATMAMAALARSQAKKLLGVYIFSNFLLLVPTRNAEIVALLAAIVVALLLLLELGSIRKDPCMATLEGIWARILMPVPLVIMLIRQFHLYNVTNLFGFVLWACLAAALIAGGTVMAGHVGVILRRTSILPIGLAWFNFVSIVHHNTKIQDGTELLLFGIPVAVFIGAVAFFERKDRLFYWVIAGITAGCTSAASLIYFPSFLASLICIAVGVVYICVGFLRRMGWLILVGLVGVFGALIYHVHAAIQVYQWSGWAGLAVIGVVIIIAASLLEKFRVLLFVGPLFVEGLHTSKSLHDQDSLDG